MAPVEQVFTFDGKSNSNTDERGRGEYISKMKWHKETLVIDGKVNVSSGEKNITSQVKLEFGLSKDGKVLTLKATRTTQQGILNLKQTFQKQ